MSESSKTVYSGKIGEVVHTEQPDGRVFEKYSRPPGVRIIIVSPDNEILITREVREETGGVDLRLPGGKVRDTIEEWHDLCKSGNNLVAATEESAKKECLEETGYAINGLKLVTIANCGATVDWDLYYFESSDYLLHPEGQQLEQGEEIEASWMDIDEIEKAISNGEMQEWRSVGVLLGLVLPEIKQSLSYN